MTGNYKIVFQAKHPRRHDSRGFGLVEIIIASAIASSSLLALAAAANIAARVVGESTERSQAEFLAEEGLESVRTLRDAGWSANIAPLSSGTAYYPVFGTSIVSWSLDVSDPGAIDGIFTREVRLEDVYRDDATQDIVAPASPGSSVDPEAREVVSRVSWSGRKGIREVELRTYLMNLFDN